MAQPSIVKINQTTYIIDPYYDKSEQPGHYLFSETPYFRIPLGDFITPRNLFSKELDSMATHLPEGAVLAGSFVASLINPAHRPSDIDIFFTSGEAFIDTYELLCNPPDADDAWALKGYKPNIPIQDILEKSKSIRLVNFEHPDPTRLPIQLIKMVWYESAAHVIDSFDFTVTQFAVDNHILTMNPASVYDLFKNNLVINRHQFPMESLYRLVKYSKKGYSASPKTYKRLVDDIRAATEMDPPLPFPTY